MRFLRIFLVPTIALGLLSGCATTIPMEPAESAAAYGCAELIVRLPDDIQGFARQDTNAQGTAAWGSPTAVLLRCGLEMPVASNDVCFTVNDIDWLANGDKDPNYFFISYGRNPAVEVIVNNTLIAGGTVLESLSEAVKKLPQEHSCLTITDVNLEDLNLVN